MFKMFFVCFKVYQTLTFSTECSGDELNNVSSEVSTAGPDAEEDQGYI